MKRWVLLIAFLAMRMDHCHTGHAQTTPKINITATPVEGSTAAEKYFQEFSGKYKSFLNPHAHDADVENKWFFTLEFVPATGADERPVIKKIRKVVGSDFVIEQLPEFIIIPLQPQPGQAGINGENAAIRDLRYIKSQSEHKNSRKKAKAESPPGIRRIFF